MRMSRDYEKLRVFHDAHALTKAIYQHTREFPRDEWFGLRAQMRRAAVSVACNIVEGSARGTIRDYLRFLYVALGSASELQYLVSLAPELGFSDDKGLIRVRDQCRDVVRQLQALVKRLEEIAATQPRSDRP